MRPDEPTPRRALAAGDREGDARRAPLPSLSAYSNIRRRTSWPNGDSEVSTKAEITLLCFAIIAARNSFSSCVPITRFAPRTSGEKIPCCVTLFLGSLAGAGALASLTAADALGSLATAGALVSVAGASGAFGGSRVAVVAASSPAHVKPAGGSGSTNFADRTARRVATERGRPVRPVAKPSALAISSDTSSGDDAATIFSMRASTPD